MTVIVAPSRRTCCVFRLHDTSFALDVALAGEVIEAQTPRALPRCPDAVLGLVNLRGQAVAAVDLAAVLELPAPPASSPVRQMLVLRTHVRLVALPIHGFDGVLSAEAAGFRSANHGAEASYIAGFQTFPSKPGLVATVLDSADLLARLDRLRFQRSAPSPLLPGHSLSFSPSVA